MLKNYPRGLLVISSVELWERFSFYTMQSLLVLYATAQVLNGGLGWSVANALTLTGIYGALVYISPVLAGIFSDPYLGRRNSVILGGVIMCFGHLTLAIHSMSALYTGITLLIIGCGFLKPSITAMVGEFYGEDDPKRDSGFAIFYMAINIGGIVGPFLGGSVSQQFGYNFAFAMAALGLVIGLITLFIGMRGSLKNIGVRVKGQVNQNKLLLSLKNLRSIEKKRVWVYLAFCVGNIVWNVVYALPYGILTEYAEKNIDRHLLGWQIPAPWFYGAYGGFIVIFSPMLASLYNKLSKKHLNFTLSYKIAAGYFLVTAGCMVLLPLVFQINLNANFVGSAWYLIGFYILFSLSELLTVPVLLSAATRMAPAGYETTLVSANMVISWGLGALLGGEFGALAVEYNPFHLFLAVIICTFLCGILHLMYNRKVEKLCEFHF